MKRWAAFPILLGLGLGLGGVSSASAQGCTSSPVAQVPTMTIKIFNDDPDHYIFPVLTTGQGTPDIWLQSIFKIPQNQVATCTYSRTNSYRIYITAAGTMPVGIAPNQNVAITIPLYTQLVATVDPTKSIHRLVEWRHNSTLYQPNSDPAEPATRHIERGRPDLSGLSRVEILQR
jgi:hypothetical protein